MTGKEVMAAQLLLGWSSERLAEASNVTLSSIYLILRLGSAGAEDNGRIRAALEAAGVEFTPAAPDGVRLLERNPISLVHSRLR